MTDYQNGYIYCSALPETRSLDQELTTSKSSVHQLTDTVDSPESALLRKDDLDRLAEWMLGLPAPLRAVAEAVVREETQASVAKRLGLSEAAVSKRMKRLLELGRETLPELRQSCLLH